MEGGGSLCSADRRIDPSGIIVINNHVVRNEHSVDVALSNGTTLPATMIGNDQRTDVAVLKVNAGHKLPFLHLVSVAPAFSPEVAAENSPV